MIIIMSAERSNLSSEVNQHNTNALRHSLSVLGLYFETVKGIYKGVSEDSFMVMGVQSSSMLERLEGLAALFNQESILVVDQHSNAFLRFMDGGVVGIGKFGQVDSIDGLDAYTILDDGAIFAVK